MLALWDSPRQCEAYTWFSVELANLRTAFRWAADQGDLDVAAAIAIYAAFLGYGVENYEPIAWAEELIEPARAVDHPRLAALCVMASYCWWPGRIEAAVRYADAAQLVMGSGRDQVPFGAAGNAGSAYVTIGQPERWVEWCRALLARGPDTHTLTRSALAFALAVAGCSDEASATANGLIDAAEATRNPYALAFALFACGFAFRGADPGRALDALRRGLVIAHDSGNRANETHLAVGLSRLEAESGDPLAAFDYLTVAIRHYHDSGTANIVSPLAVLAAFLDRLGHYEPAATVAGYAISPITAAAFPEIKTAIAHLRDVLGDPAYEALAREGEMMTTAAIARYAFDQIDQARTELEHPG